MILSAVIIVAAISVKAQQSNTVRFSLGGEIGAVTGNLNSAYGAAIGATGQVEYKATSDLGITGNAGIIALTGKNIKGTNFKVKSTALIPLLVGIKYYFTAKTFGSAQLGTSLATGNGGGSSFTYIPGIGYQFNERIDALFKYTGYASDGGTVGLRIGYTF